MCRVMSQRGGLLLVALGTISLGVAGCGSDGHSVERIDAAAPGDTQQTGRCVAMLPLEKVAPTATGFVAEAFGHSVRVEVTPGPRDDERTMAFYLDGDREGAHEMPIRLDEYLPELPVITASVTPGGDGDAIFYALAEGGSIPRVSLNQAIYTASEAVRLDERTVLYAGIAPRQVADGPYLIPTDQEMADAGCG